MSRRRPAKADYLELDRNHRQPRSSPTRTRTLRRRSNRSPPGDGHAPGRGFAGRTPGHRRTTDPRKGRPPQPRPKPPPPSHPHVVPGATAKVRQGHIRATGADRRRNPVSSAQPVPENANRLELVPKPTATLHPHLVPGAPAKVPQGRIQTGGRETNGGTRSAARNPSPKTPTDSNSYRNRRQPFIPTWFRAHRRKSRQGRIQTGGRETGGGPRSAARNPSPKTPTDSNSYQSRRQPLIPTWFRAHRRRSVKVTSGRRSRTGGGTRSAARNPSPKTPTASNLNRNQGQPLISTWFQAPRRRSAKVTSVRQERKRPRTPASGAQPVPENADHLEIDRNRRQPSSPRGSRPPT